MISTSKFIILVFNDVQFPSNSSFYWKYIYVGIGVGLGGINWKGKESYPVSDCGLYIFYIHHYMYI